MTGAPVVIGPFVGGLNTYSESTAIGDDEAVELLNFDVDLDGSLVNRPGLTSIDVTQPTARSNKFLGTFYDNTTGAFYIIYQRSDNNLIWFNTNNGTFGFVKTNITASAVVQYMNKLWVVAAVGSASGGGSWVPSTGWTAIAAIPRGNAAVIYKERMFISSGSLVANPSRLYFSDPTDPSSWPGTNTADVANGDGQDIQTIYVFAGQIVVFKSNSTYTYGYDSSPTKGVVQKQNGSIGVANSSCVVEFESSLYVLHATSAYEINNWNWSQINVKVPFKQYNWSAKATTEDQAISVVGNRLICRFFDNFYVYGLKTRAWSLWQFNTSQYVPSRWIRSSNLDPAGRSIFYTDSYAPSQNLNSMFDSPTGANPETFTCRVTTKTYDYNSPYSFKRLHHWGVDLLGKTNLNFQVTPTVYNVPVRWSQLQGRKWSTLLTWRKPIDLSINVTSSANLTNPNGTRSYLKVIKSLRFRQISFTLSTTVDGTAVTTPFRIFKLSAFTSNKELVSKQVS